MITSPEDRQTEQLAPVQPSSNLRAFFAGRMPIPPSINHDKKPHVARGMVGTDELHQFKADAALLLSQGYHDWPLINAIRESKRKVPLRVELHFFFRYMWKNDADDRIKHALDATFQRLGINDNQVVDLHVVKHADFEDQRTEIEIYCDLSTR